MIFADTLHLSLEYNNYIVQYQSFEQGNYEYLDICRDPASVIKLYQLH